MKRILFGLLVIGLIELALLVKAGQAFGTWFPLAAVLLSMAAGILVIRHYGLRTARALGDALRTGAAPAVRPANSLAGVAAGILLILPGFLSDLGAILLLIPPLRSFLVAVLGLKVISYQAGATAAKARQAGPVIDGEVVEVDPDNHSRPGIDVHSRPGIDVASPWRR